MNYPRKILSTVFIAIMMIAIIAGLSLIIQLRPTVPDDHAGATTAYPAPLLVVNPTSPPYPAPEYPTPEVDTSIQPPLCQFPIYTPVSAAPLTTTVFSYSEPKVVLTHEMAIDIAGWLPDSERLLITRYTAGDWRFIETYNTKTAETILLAEGKGVGGLPFWISGIESVAYNIFMYDYREIWLSRGKPEETEQISNDGMALSVSPDGKQLLYFSPSAGQAPHTWDASSKINQSLSVNLADWRYPKYSGNNASLARRTWIQASWSPDNSKIVFNSNPWLFVYDTTSGQICEIDLGKAEGEALNGPRWALKAEWSPDGRFIALLTTISPPQQLLPFLDLMLVDVATGAQQSIQLPISPNYEGQFVNDITWSPDSSRIAALSYLNRDKGGYAEEGLFIITLATGAIEQVPSPERLGGGTTLMQLAWSGDGSQIAVNCPTPEMGRLCITAVEISGAQP